MLLLNVSVLSVAVCDDTVLCLHDGLLSSCCSRDSVIIYSGVCNRLAVKCRREISNYDVRIDENQPTHVTDDLSRPGARYISRLIPPGKLAVIANSVILIHIFYILLHGLHVTAVLHDTRIV